MFQVGQKVVCVDAANQCECGCTTGLREKSIYTITEVLFSGKGVRVAESTPSIWRNGYFASRFRPIVERKTDISVFTDMLTPSPARSPAPALS